ncbi:MAG: tRNA (N(6)-L-threonylcarbamoyladenosine(37)-C(2))-methylthiotransferase MtaB [Lentisphaerae bacterium]|jgi:threonylcarbamoyladenosine tRNA methylthiotransferase MtaB|nr:tRNA (N(6)-L-threonylcarbamoyladenosine(37)-C(2))-methylthiotransferase MtaB [Lentisphaerota bacterium]MBT4819792.1 tRNA (N(6)-L-threonylcarbamoyladenosine(37)-C(2))-methylthiotransferase MtaB [Lentisphaerota bacterium]MBT5607746.1 tRNA (N(6)-L-threonylcarbamoyladenosine(37)-C(2))-methylthiotransferase MtaB [Lentisphaerota bacterium]MBT7054909.1 tRNA (N(6)-L-threonylcarbamoyladenosine(37)-C(2))-methylthiotransferase MtaB [Lentisphaerota bacterium]MBT7843321.1 tRNA (N(6)-L-threonylcarbamoylad
MSEQRHRCRRASFHTLGCRLNQADTGLMSDDLRRHGYEIVPWGQDADVLVINGCTVTGPATQKTRQAVRGARRRCSDAFIVLAGCPVDVARGEEMMGTGADLLLPNPGKGKLRSCLPGSGFVQGMAASSPIFDGKGESFVEEGCGYYPERTRANLKIQEGCDFSCSYCIVPVARGPARSRRWDDILREARELLDNGHRELVMTGVNIATYRDGGRDLADLVDEMCELPGDLRLRLSSTEPGPVLHRIIDTMARRDNVCRFLHLPIQYGEDGILNLMNRRYSVAEFREFVAHARSVVDSVCIGSDVIVGFPGEDERAFSRCMETMEELAFDYLHVFTYSPRPGTAAADMPGQVEGATASVRHRRLSALAQEQSIGFAESQVGKDLVVLIETRREGNIVAGWSDNYLRVEIGDPDNEVSANEFVTARVTQVLSGRRVVGELVT